MARSSILLPIGCAASLLVLLSGVGCRRKSFSAASADATYREYAYVSSGDTGTVSVLDLVNLRVDRVLTVAANPVAVVSSPTRNELYTVSAGSAGGDGTLSVIDAATNQVAATIPLHRSPSAISLDAAGRLAYIANRGSNSVSVVDLEARREIHAVPVTAAPQSLRVSADGRALVVASGAVGSVFIYGLSASAPPALRAVFSGCSGAGDVATIPVDRSQPTTKAFVVCGGSDRVMAIALAAAPDSWTARQDGASTQDHLLASLAVGRSPSHLAVKPDGGEIFVSNTGANTISEISTWTNEVGGTYRVGDGPSRALVAADNSTLWIANSRGDSLAIYSIEDGRLAAGVRTGAVPDAIALSADEHLMLVADTRSGDVAVIRTRDRNGPELFTMLPAGSRPNSIAVKAYHLK